MSEPNKCVYIAYINSERNIASHISPVARVLSNVLLISLSLLSSVATVI